MKRTIVLLALVMASVSAVPASAWDTRDTVIVLGTLAVDRLVLQPMRTAPPSYGQPQYPGQQHRPGYAQPRVINAPSTVVIVAGARHNADGTCTQSNGRTGTIRSGMCFVSD